MGVLTAREMKARNEWVKKHLMYTVVDAMQGGSSSVVAVPGAPVLSIASYPSATSVSVSWTTPSGSPTSYNIYVDGVLFGNVAASPSTVTGIPEGGSVDIYVTAVNAGGEGDPSNTVTADTSYYFPTVTNSRLWLSRDRNLYTDTAGTTPAALNDSIASWRSVGGDWGTDLLTQATSSKRPTLKSDGIQCDGVDDWLACSIAIGADFTIYWVGSRSATNQNMFSAVESPSNTVIFKSDISKFFVLGLALAYAGTGLECVRIRRTGGTLYFKHNGATEISVASAVTMTANSFMGSNAYGGSKSGGRMNQFVQVDRCITPGDADDLAILGKLQLLEPTAVGP